MKTLVAREIMQRDVLTVPETLSVHDLAGLFSEKMISGAPVLDTKGKLKGVVSLTDIVRNDSHRWALVTNTRAGDFYLHGWENKINDEDMRGFQVEEDDGLCVRDIMTSKVWQVTEETPVTDMADMMIKGRIHRLLVTTKGKVVGIVSTLDLLKAIRHFQ